MLSRLLKWSMPLILIFVSISFFVSMSFSVLRSAFMNEITLENYLSPMSLKIDISGASVADEEPLSLLCGIPQSVLFYKEYPFSNGYAVISLGKIADIVPMLEGRFILSEDINHRCPVAVIGKGLVESLITTDSKRFIVHEMHDYEVVGIMGLERQESVWDNIYFVNFNAVTRPILNGTFYLDARNKRDTLETFRRIEASVNDTWSGAVISGEPVSLGFKTPLFRALHEEELTVKVIITVVFSLALNTVSITSYWLIPRQRELAVKKLVGYHNTRMALEVIKQYVVLVSLAFCIGLFFYVLILYLDIFDILDSSVYLSTTIISFVFCLLIGIATACVPIYYVCKLEVMEVLR